MAVAGCGVYLFDQWPQTLEHNLHGCSFSTFCVYKTGCYLGVRERLKRKAVQRLAVDMSLGRPKVAKSSRGHEPDLFELPPLPKAQLAEGGDDYYELPIHNVLYSGDIDFDQVVHKIM